MGQIGSGEHAFTITPHDTNHLAHATRGICVGVAGNIKVTMVGGEEVVWPNMAAGTIHAIAAIILWSAGTTASGTIIGTY